MAAFHLALCRLGGGHGDRFIVLAQGLLCPLQKEVVALCHQDALARPRSELHHVRLAGVSTIGAKGLVRFTWWLLSFLTVRVVRLSRTLFGPGIWHFTCISSR